jgi:aminoglycoside phosphotransferase (APT) family kinase protein
VARQVQRWSSQWELTRPRTRELKGLDEITGWLRSHLPEEVPATVVHGDYKLDNVMFARGEPKLLAIFDWEMATVGDPLADVGWFMNHWAPMPRPAGYPVGGAIPAPLTTRPGFPAVPEMAAMYEERSGRRVRDLLFYRVLASYKGAVILEGLYMHYLEGAAANPGAADFEWRVPMTIESIQQLIAAEG